MSGTQGALLDVQDICKTFPNGVKAVEDVSLVVRPGETLGVVGESGCGKSTTAKLILRTLAPDQGSIWFDGTDLLRVKGRELRRLRSQLQVVPQNPQTSLNPKISVRASIEFNLRDHEKSASVREVKIDKVLDQVGLPSRYGSRFPHELSGGQLQRAAIARAIATDPKLVICDEAVSALDKSIQAQVLNLLVELQDELGMAYLFISHDLGVVQHISDDVVVMYLGRVVESGSASALWKEPQHPYTKALLSAAPGHNQKRIVLRGDLPSPINPPSGCTFRTRCPDMIDECATTRPPLLVSGERHYVSCLVANEARES